MVLTKMVCLRGSRAKRRTHYHDIEIENVEGAI